MAVDTRKKRFSLLNFGDGTTIHILFQRDGSIDLNDRQHLLDCYSGIAFGAPVIPPALAIKHAGFLINTGKLMR